jgi:hypothetical protein
MSSPLGTDPYRIQPELAKMRHRAIVTWIMHKRFTYAAIKITDRWYTTATDANTIVGQTLSDRELARVLTDENTSSVAKAVSYSSWVLLPRP